MSDVWLLAVGIAASPFPIIPAILLLFTTRPIATSTSFLAGWATGIAIATTVFVVMAEIVDTREDTPTWVAWTRVALGSALIALAIQRWLTRGKSKPVPAWMATLQTAGPAKAARLGVVLSAANPKILLLTAAAGLSIGSDGNSGAEVAVWVLAFTVLASSTVAAPMLLRLLLGLRILQPLSVARDWLQTNNAAVMAIVFAVIGVVVVTEGISGL